jgi:hypothetical protein
MYRVELLDCLDLDNDLTLDDQINPLWPQWSVPIVHDDLPLTIEPAISSSMVIASW